MARLHDRVLSSAPMIEAFADNQTVQAMLDVEAALSRVEADLGLVPSSAAEAIEAACRAELYDIDMLAREGRANVTVAIPLVKALTERVRQSDEDAARWVHWGATSQDIVDTALVLQLRRATGLLRADLDRVVEHTARLARAHADTVMLGRTLLQAATPVTFGLKAAQWHAMAKRCRARLDPDLRPVPAAPGARPSADYPAPDYPAPDDPEPDHLAYVLFTSGSTGEPKPVLTGRRAIAAATGALRAQFALTPADRVLQFASLSWDTSLEEILPTLSSGACLVFHDDAYAGSFPRWLRMVARERITVLDLPTAFWHELVGYLAEAGAPLPGSVRLVVIGGEAVSPARLADWCALPTGHARLLNTYGCTETTLVTHAVDLHGPRATAPAGGWSVTSPVPIGRPLPHVRQHLTAEGELLVGGPSLAVGYRGQPAATRDRFVTTGGRRFFRTGDRVRRRPDGSLELLGRLDQQLKVRGVRVDPAEVEAHLAGHPAVRAVAVTGIRVADHTVLAAYVVARRPDATAGLAGRLTDYLRTRVPAHLVPSRIEVVGELAYTASGKLDRHRIAAAEARP